MEPDVLRWFTSGTAGSPLILLHGFTGAAASWDAVARSLAASPRSRPVCAVVLPGHHPRRPVVGDWAANIANMAKILAMLGEIGKVHLCGYSLGARIALGLAAERPDWLGELTLIGVHPGLTGPAQRAERRAADRRWVELLRDHGIARFVTAWEDLAIFASQKDLDARTLARQRAIRAAHDPGALAASLTAMGLAEMPDYRAALARLPVPLTLVTGAADPKFTELARQLARARAATGAAVRHAIIPGCGHNPVLERPDAVADLLAARTADARVSCLDRDVSIG